MSPPSTEPNLHSGRSSQYQGGRPPSTIGRYIGLIIFSLIGIGVVCVGGFYQSEIMVYFSQQGWNSAEVEKFTREFVKSAYDKKPAAAEKLDPQWVKPVVKGNRLTGITQMGATGPVTIPVRNLVPSDQVKKVVIRLKFKAGEFESAAEYPDGRWAVFAVKRLDNGLRIKKIATELTKEQPQPKPWD